MIFHGVKSKSKSLTNKLSTGSALDFLSWSLKFFYLQNIDSFNLVLKSSFVLTITSLSNF